MKKIIEIIALPLVLALGHAAAAAVLFAVAIAIATYIGWLIGMSIEELNGYILALDAVTLVVFLSILSSRRFRVSVADAWKQISSNL